MVQKNRQLKDALTCQIQNPFCFQIILDMNRADKWNATEGPETSQMRLAEEVNNLRPCVSIESYRYKR